jgi:hypothetical protein
VAGSCEHSNEPLVCIEGGEFLLHGLGWLVSWLVGWLVG